MEEIKPGDLVFLTMAFEEYMCRRNPHLTIPIANRLAKVEDIIDWESDKGKMIKSMRVKSGKWDGLPIEDSKYILSIYYHELVGRNGKKGVAERGVPMFGSHPETKAPFFQKVPDWVFKEIMKKCESFEVELKDVP